MFGRVGVWEMVLVVVVLLIIFGPGRLAGLGQSLGRGVREFRSAAARPDEALEEPPPQTRGGRKPPAGGEEPKGG